MVINIGETFGYGGILRRARKAAGKTQRDAAFEYGIEERALRRWENKEFNPRVCDFFGLLTMYGIKIEVELE